jgi:alginate O-acetyltransferase complex protein AlgI
MLFNTPQYILFLALVVFAVRMTTPARRGPLLLAASVVFYSLWLPVYLLLLAADLGVNYVLLRRMVKSSRPRVYLAASVIFTLALLARFKYAAFAIETAMPLLTAVMDVPPEIPHLFLPLGISFYSFQIVALTVDTYRRNIDPIDSFWRYALFISFFPQLIAGPILRGAQLLPQLLSGGSITRERTHRGMWLLLSGAVKKIILADFLLAPFVNAAYTVPGYGSAGYHLVVAFSFLFQVYYDFSGYVDMARGSALLLGFELPHNFLEPYLARTPAEFWRRWHITLSDWLRDYIYIPLGGNRQGVARGYTNLIITMVLGGLWHGAAWPFVMWGGLHGIWLAVHRAIGGDTRTFDEPVVWRDAPRVAATFIGMALVQASFRSPSLEVALEFYGGFGAFDFLSGWPPFQTAIVVLCYVLHIAERQLRLRMPELRARARDSYWATAAEGALAGLLVGTAWAVSGAGGEFIYFQF